MFLWHRPYFTVWFIGYEGQWDQYGYGYQQSGAVDQAGHDYSNYGYGWGDQVRNGSKLNDTQSRVRIYGRFLLFFWNNCRKVSFPRPF